MLPSVTHGNNHRSPSASLNTYHSVQRANITHELSCTVPTLTLLPCGQSRVLHPPTSITSFNSLGTSNTAPCVAGDQGYALTNHHATDLLQISHVRTYIPRPHTHTQCTLLQLSNAPTPSLLLSHNLPHLRVLAQTHPSNSLLDVWREVPLQEFPHKPSASDLKCTLHTIRCVALHIEGTMVIHVRMWRNS